MNLVTYRTSNALMLAALGFLLGVGVVALWDTFGIFADSGGLIPLLGMYLVVGFVYAVLTVVPYLVFHAVRRNRPGARRMWKRAGLLFVLCVLAGPLVMAGAMNAANDWMFTIPAVLLLTGWAIRYMVGHPREAAASPDMGEA